MPDPFDAVYGVIKSCKNAKDRAVQNKKRCVHLVEIIEGVEPTLESIGRDSMMRQKQVSKLKDVIEEAQKLIQKQSKRSSFMSQMCFSSSFKEDFDWVEKRVFQHMNMIQFNRSTSVSTNNSSPIRTQKLNAVAPDAPGPEGDVQILGRWCEQCVDLNETFGFFDVDSKTEEGRKRLGLVLDDKGRVAVLEWGEKSLKSLSPAPADLGRLNALWGLNLRDNELKELPQEIAQLTSLTNLFLDRNKLKSLPAVIGQLTSLTDLRIVDNKLADLPGKIIGRLTSLDWLWLHDNKLTSLPAEIGRLTSLTELTLHGNKLTSLPAEIGRLTSLTGLFLQGNKLTSVPAEIGRLTSLTALFLYGNQLTSLPAEIGRLRELGCELRLDDGVTIEGENFSTYAGSESDSDSDFSTSSSGSDY